MGTINQELVDNLLSRQDLQLEDAMYLLRAGHKVRRAAWRDVRYIAMQRPDENSKMKRAYFYAVPADNQAYPYALSNSDIFASDWQAHKE